MATRMQQRRGTASQWTSANPVLNAGELGWESDTNKFKIGDGTNHWADLDYFADTNSTVVPTFGTSIVFEGATADSYETTLQVTDPTADRTITFPDATGTVALTANVAALSGATFTGAVSGTDLTLSGNLTVNGTTTNINSTNLVIEDKNVILGDVATPSDVTADGGGITLKGATDKTFNWVDSTDSWTSSEHINLASGKSYYVNGTPLKDVTETLTNKTFTAPTLSGTVTLGGSGDFTITSDADIVLDPNANVYIGSATAGNEVVTFGGTQTLTNKTISSGTLTGTLTAGGGAGTNGQVLQSTGSGVQWSTPAAGAAFSELMLIGA